jgi:uncharacterized protein YdaU (DUF1376 family)
MPISSSFPFFPSDYLGDPHTIVMTTEENGAYCLLLWVCWEQEGLSDDLGELAGYARMPVRKFALIWEKRLKRCFIFDEKRGQFLHPRFEKIIKEKKAFRKAKKEAGKASGRKRREQKRLDSEQVFDSVQHNSNENEPSISSSISSSNEVSKDTSKEREAPAPEPPSFWLEDACVQSYKKHFPGFELSIPVQEKIVLRVEDIAIWNEALDFWVDNKYREQSVGKMLAKYDELVEEKKNGTVKQFNSSKRHPEQVKQQSEQFFKKKFGLA